MGWIYRSIIEELFGLKGTKEGLSIAPKFPEKWNSASVTRAFRGATFTISFKRNSSNTSAVKLIVNDEAINGNTITNIEPDKHYIVIATII